MVHYPQGPFTVQRVMNNNAIMAGTKDDQEVIILGKGIGFGRKVGDVLTTPHYEKIYVVPEGVSEQKALALMEQVEPTVLSVTEELIKLAKERLGDLHPKIYLALADHINFAIIRLKQGMEIKNPLLTEIEALYPEEFSLAKEGAKLIAEKVGVSIPGAEVGFIALHLHSARHNRQVGQALKNTEVIREIVDFLEEELKVAALQAVDALAYTRLITHLQSCIQRLAHGTTVENPFLERLQTEFKVSSDLAKVIGSMIERGLGLEVPEDEIGYLTLHIERIRRNLK